MPLESGLSMVTFTRHCWTVLVIAAWIGLAPEARAGWLGFRNDLSHAVIVQVAADGQAAKRGASYHLYPGEVTWDWVCADCSRHITIYDARGDKPMLVRFEACLGKDDLLYAIQATDNGVQAVKVSGAKKTPK